MVKNVGMIDRIARFLVALFLAEIGLFRLNGLEGNVSGIVVAIISLIPLYMVITRSCFVFRWFRFHSLSNVELLKFGDPYKKKDKKPT
ncbi:MAG: DUF2892 domain-containing protein [Balneolales bacterium]|nr:DUF2892 domain-containing protein [Balneolales bacterium]